MSAEELAVGRIARAHGIRGEVSVEPLSEVEDRYAPGSVLRLEDGRSLTVASTRPHGQWLLVRFQEVGDRTTAEALRGQVLLVAASDSPSIEEEGRFWVHEVVGLEAVTEEGRSLGRVREVLHNPANDIWVAEGPAGRALIPAVHDVVAAVDREGGRVVVRDVPGLFPEDPRMANANEILVRRAYEAQSRGDVDAYLDLLGDDFVLHIPGRSRIAGDYRGSDAVRRHFADVAELSGGRFQARVHDVLAGDEHVVGLVEARAERERVTVELPRVHVWHVRHGKLAELWLHPLDQYAFDEYWG